MSSEAVPGSTPKQQNHFVSIWLKRFAEYLLKVLWAVACATVVAAQDWCPYAPASVMWRSGEWGPRTTHFVTLVNCLSPKFSSLQRSASFLKMSKCLRRLAFFWRGPRRSHQLSNELDKFYNRDIACWPVWSWYHTYLPRTRRYHDYANS